LAELVYIYVGFCSVPYYGRPACAADAGILFYPCGFSACDNYTQILMITNIMQNKPTGKYMNNYEYKQHVTHFKIHKTIDGK